MGRNSCWRPARGRPPAAGAGIGLRLRLRLRPPSEPVRSSSSSPPSPPSSFKLPLHTRSHCCCRCIGLRLRRLQVCSGLGRRRRHHRHGRRRLCGRRPLRLCRCRHCRRSGCRQRRRGVQVVTIFNGPGMSSRSQTHTQTHKVINLNKAPILLNALKISLSKLFRDYLFFCQKLFRDERDQQVTKLSSRPRPY